MATLAKEKSPQGKVRYTVKIRVLYVDSGRCDSGSTLWVIMETDLTKDLHKMGTKDGILNSLYTCSQFTTCTKDTVPSVNVSLWECAGKASLFGGQGYKRCNCKTLYRKKFCSCRNSNKLCSFKCYNLSCENKWHSCWDTPWFFYIFFVSLFVPTCVMKSIILLIFFKGKSFSLNNWIVIYPFFLPLLLYVYIPQPKLAISHIS